MKRWYWDMWTAILVVVRPKYTLRRLLHRHDGAGFGALVVALYLTLSVCVSMALYVTRTVSNSSAIVSPITMRYGLYWLVQFSFYWLWVWMSNQLANRDGGLTAGKLSLIYAVASIPQFLTSILAVFSVWVSIIGFTWFAALFVGGVAMAAERRRSIVTKVLVVFVVVRILHAAVVSLLAFYGAGRWFVGVV